MFSRRGHNEVEDTSGESLAFERIADAPCRIPTSICGIVVRMRAQPSTNLPNFEVVIEDPSGTAIAVWLGRRAIGGVGLGRRILLTGVASQSPRGPVFVNPEYTLLP